MKRKTAQSRVFMVTGILIVCGILIAIGSGCTGMWGGWGGSWGHQDCGWGCGGCDDHCGWSGCGGYSGGCGGGCDDCKPQFIVKTTQGCDDLFANKGKTIEIPSPSCDPASACPINFDMDTSPIILPTSIDIDIPTFTFPDVPAPPSVGLP
jgi:hypothetical protein